MATWAFINDEFIREERACIHFRDLALQRGYGVFDFFRLEGQTPVFLNLHLKRLFYSAREMHLPLEKTEVELKAIISELIARNNLPNSGIRITLTGGYSADGYQVTIPNLVITQQPFQSPGKEQFQKGIKLVTYEHQRQLPHVKTIDYLIGIWLQPYIKERGADDVLYHQQNILTECPRSNFFIVTNENRIVTPAQHILKGITRNILMEIAREKFEVEERNIRLEEVLLAKEAFITSTTKNILPVVAVNESVIGIGSAGMITELLLKLLQAHHQKRTSVS
jgi:D-alanine transaminase/branched-chain amino acid aminotransferase